MLLSAVPGVSAAGQAPEIPGDIDGDGSVTILDATVIQRFLAALDALDESAQRRGRVTGGAELSILDATAIQRYLVGMIDRFPAEDVPEAPTQAPTEIPTQVPTETPSEAPTVPPTEPPTQAPTVPPTVQPTEAPTQVPTQTPTQVPTETPSEAPTLPPAEPPTQAPTEPPTEIPATLPTEPPTEPPNEPPTEPPGEKKNYTWCQTSAPVSSYLADAHYDPSDYTVSVIGDYAPAEPQLSNEQPSGLTLYVGDGTLEAAGRDVPVTNGTATVCNLIPNTAVPYIIRDANGEIICSGTLTATHFLRQIKCPEARNVRDIGGWQCDGGTVAYGKIIRGGLPRASDRAVLVDELGIAVDIELRGLNDQDWTPPTVSGLGEDIPYYVFDRYAWYSLSDKALWTQIMRAVVDAVLDDKPVYLHCGAGADRTGTVLCLIEALLGMSPGDIDMEYELTSFFTGGSDSYARRRNKSGSWGLLIGQLNARQGETFRDKAVQYMRELGFTLDEINAFRSKMIDGDPITLTAE